MVPPRARREVAREVSARVFDVAVSGDPRGSTLRLRVAPGARRDEVVGLHGDALKVAVRAPPERGRANDAVLDLIADRLGVSRAQVSLERGAASRDKTVRILGLDPAEVRRRLGTGEAVGGTSGAGSTVSASSGARSRRGASRSE